MYVVANKTFEKEWYLTKWYLMQSISMAIQRGNAQCVIGTAPTSGGLEGLFEFAVHDKELT